MKYKLKVYSIWEPGQRVDSEMRPHQEDSIFPAYEQQKDSDRLFILCDGMGGHEAGEVASATVCSAMSKSVYVNAPDAEGDFSDDNLRKAIADAFDALDALSHGDVSSEKKMGTTMTFLKFHNKGCTIAHMGDSRVYHIRPGKGRDDSKILFKTYDHSLVNDLIRVGELTPEEAKLSKQKNIITRAMQPNMERRPKPDVYHTADIKPGDYFYMCSDGMLEQMEDDNLLFNFSEATGDDKNKVKILTQATSQNSDNHSAIIVHVLDVIDPLPIEADPILPAANKPMPIMVEVDDEESQTDKAVVEKTRQGENSGTKVQSLNRRKFIYIYIVFLLAMSAFGVFFVVSFFNNRPQKEPVKIENSQKPSKKPERRRHNSDSGQNPSQQLPNKPNDSLAPDNTNPNDQASTGANSVNPPVPNKIYNALSSHPSQSGGNDNAETTDDVNSTGGNNNNNISPFKLNQVSQHAEDVVPSDQQVAIDAANHGKKKP